MPASQVKCPACSTPLRFVAPPPGDAVKCPYCGKLLRVTAAPARSPAPTTTSPTTTPHGGRGPIRAVPLTTASNVPLAPPGNRPPTQPSASALTPSATGPVRPPRKSGIGVFLVAAAAALLLLCAGGLGASIWVLRGFLEPSAGVAARPSPHTEPPAAADPLPLPGERPAPPLGPPNLPAPAPKPDLPRPPAAEIAVSAGQLVADYAQDANAADSRYKGKRLVVNGFIRTMTGLAAVDGTPRLLEAPDERAVNPVRATLAAADRPALLEMVRGDPVIVGGECAGRRGNGVELENARIVTEAARLATDAGGPGDPEAAPELKRLAGWWSRERGASVGVPHKVIDLFEPDPHPDLGYSHTVEGDKLTCMVGKAGGRQLLLRVYPRKSPPEIDVFADRYLLRGIYELTDTRLRISVGERARPKGFDAFGEPGALVLNLRRVR